MARAKHQILVIPFRKIETNIEYCIMKRSDTSWWQFIAGGGEDQETPFESAKREAFEEAKISFNSDYIELESIASIPAVHFNFIWGDNVFVIPEYTFAVEISESIKLSSEHLEYKWVSYNIAREMLEFDSNKNALWELDYKLKSKIV